MYMIYKGFFIEHNIFALHAKREDDSLHRSVAPARAPGESEGKLKRSHIMVYKSSPVWTISSESLIEHLKTLDAPDQLYWDSRQLKKEGQKFQSLDWANWKRPTKADGAWRFA